MTDRAFFRRMNGEGLVPWLKRCIKYRLEHVRWRDVVVNRETGETARWYPDHAGGSMHHKDWWALVKPNQLENLEGRFASKEPETHICKIKKHKPGKQLLDMRYNPLSNEEDISIPCRVCRSYSCCSPDEHGITEFYERARKAFTGEDKAERVSVKQGEGANLAWESE